METLDAFYGEIRLFAGNFAPAGWAFCDGSILQIAQNTALFSLLGNTYGGDGIRTFALPDLRGKVPIGQGQGVGLSNRRMGSQGGAESVSLSIQNLPAHSHSVMGANISADGKNPKGTAMAQTNGDNKLYQTNDTDNLCSLNQYAVTASQGAGEAHNNMMPFNSLNYIISLYGIYPTRK
jgi:microcystin-dependent protein